MQRRLQSFDLLARPLFHLRFAAQAITKLTLIGLVAAAIARIWVSDIPLLLGVALLAALPVLIAEGFRLYRALDGPAPALWEIVVRVLMGLVAAMFAALFLGLYKLWPGFAREVDRTDHYAAR